MTAITEFQRAILRELSLRPHGAPFREEEAKAAIVALSDKQLVCDPHAMGSALFTRITEEGRQALQASDQ